MSKTVPFALDKEYRVSIPKVEELCKKECLQMAQQKISTQNPEPIIQTHVKEDTSISLAIETVGEPTLECFLKSMSSQFWIQSGEFSLGLDIDYIDPKQLQTLYRIFTRTSCYTEDLVFGIDHNKFSENDPLDIYSNSNCTLSGKAYSDYWFSNGYLSIKFRGKYLLPSKIQRLFHFIKDSTNETGVLRFGVDDIEFSNLPEFWHQSSTFFVDSSYSMLVKQRRGDSNVMIDDLEEYDNQSENIDSDVESLDDINIQQPQQEQQQKYISETITGQDIHDGKQQGCLWKYLKNWVFHYFE